MAPHIPLQTSDYMALYFLVLLWAHHFLFQHNLKYRAMLSQREEWTEPAEDPGKSTRGRAPGETQASYKGLAGKT